MKTFLIILIISYTINFLCRMYVKGILSKGNLFILLNKEEMKKIEKINDFQARHLLLNIIATLIYIIIFIIRF